MHMSDPISHDDFRHACLRGRAQPRFVATLVAVAGILAALPCAVAENAIAKERAPNTVFILADDLGYTDLACLGRSDVVTPNVDRHAAEGVGATKSYVTRP